MRVMTGGEYCQDRKGIEVNMIGKSFHCFIYFGGKKRSNTIEFIHAGDLKKKQQKRIEM